MPSKLVMSAAIESLPSLRQRNNDALPCTRVVREVIGPHSVIRINQHPEQLRISQVLSSYIVKTFVLYNDMLSQRNNVRISRHKTAAQIGNRVPRSDLDLR